MGADDTGEDIEIGVYNSAPTGTVLSFQVGSGGNASSTDPTLLVDSTLFFQNPAFLAQAASGSAVLAFNNSFVGAAVSGNNSGGGGGVSGNCDNGLGVLGTSKTKFGVSGISSPSTNLHASAGVLGTSNESGTGVSGVSGPGFVPLPFPGFGVGGFGSQGGVRGVSLHGVGVAGGSDNFIGVYGTSQYNRGGVFYSGTKPENFGTEVPNTTHDGIAQVRLVPSSAQTLPKKANIGDLFVMYSPKNQLPNAPVNLFLCVKNMSAAQWQQVQLAPKIYKGGDTPF